MDYSKVKYVKPSVDGLDITKDKVYDYIPDNGREDYGIIEDDAYDEIYIHCGKNTCVHLDDLGYFIPCAKDGTPL